MTDTRKIIEEQINQEWARGTNWAMQGLGYALDTNADTQAVAEERARAVGEGANLGVNNFETWKKQIDQLLIEAPAHEAYEAKCKEIDEEEHIKIIDGKRYQLIEEEV